MTQHIEKGTNYAYTVERMKEINFRSLRSVSVEFTKRLPVELSSELYTNIQHGVCQLQSEPELNMYIHALGLMHEAKLQYAFEHLSDDFINHQTIDIIDYGCGQAIGTICYADFVRKKGSSQQVRRVVLIEPSEIALKRAALHVSRFFPQAEIVTCLKGFDDLEEDDLCVDEEIPTLHILSNVIDLADDYFNLERFVGLINQCSIGENHYLCIEPYFDYEKKDKRFEFFIELLDAEAYYSKTFSKGTFVEGHDWTCQVAICKNNSLSFKTCGALIHTEENSIIQTVDEAHINDKNRLIELAKCADKKKQYREAFECYKLAAEVNNAEAQYRLGCYYYNGKGTELDYSEAIKWFRKAVEQGYAPAQCFLGYCFEFGVGVQQDNTTAVDLYLKASEQGFAAAQHNLGHCYENGRGVLKDESAAIKWYCKAAEQGFASAQCKLGYFYNNGIGITKDSAEAVRWYRKAADQGYVLAQYNLGVCFANGCGVEKDDVEAIEWYRKAAEQGYMAAQYNLGFRYEKGEGVMKDEDEAIKWYIAAEKQGDNRAKKRLENYSIKYAIYNRDWLVRVAEHGYAKAQFDLAECIRKECPSMFFSKYSYTHTFTSEYRTIFELYLKAAQQNHIEAQYELGQLYEQGKGIEQSFDKAVEWFLRAAEQNYDAAKYRLFELYALGKGVKKSITEAVSWLNKCRWEKLNLEPKGLELYSIGKKYYYGLEVDQSYTEAIIWWNMAIEENCDDARYMLGVCYEKGQGIEQSYEKAFCLFHEAAERGLADAENAVGVCYEKGQGVEQSYEEAVKWYSGAAEKRNKDAMCNLGNCYRYGRTVKRSYSKAIQWYKKSGTYHAQEALKEIYSKNFLHKWIKIIQFEFGILK